MRKLMPVLSMVLAAGCLESVEMTSDLATQADASIVTDDAGVPRGSFTYPGCADETQACPQDLVYVCAKTAIARSHGACSAADDCVEVALEGDPITGCPPPLVNSAEVEAFKAEMQTPIDRYVAVTNCRSSGQCVSGAVAACVDGFCVWTPAP